MTIMIITTNPLPITKSKNSFSAARLVPEVGKLARSPTD